MQKGSHQAKDRHVGHVRRKKGVHLPVHGLLLLLHIVTLPLHLLQLLLQEVLGLQQALDLAAWLCPTLNCNRRQERTS